ncbi:sensor domain-containing phosphodiesterase [Methylobacillus gramineus]|uniref:putative bifunctional diguanylate cyclase/phosphodiesterase n=1 Tax=Methylobacillus gramineus TaxID=755169 RepID=UPI001CFFBE95|nr:sensor domain-containing phosphodiesterase [Methylobacillus gramineus]MCB5185238.1 sensor domain-containing phosphodiesterase [Methylobacillus gramineus]
MQITPPIPFNEEQRLATLQSLCLLDTPPDASLDLITELAAKLFNVPISLISLIDHGRQWFKSKTGLSVAETHRNQAFCAYAIHSLRPVVVLDTHDDPRFSEHPLVLGYPHIRFYAGIPLIMDEEIGIGTLCIIGTEPKAHFSSDELNTLAHLATMVVQRIETLQSIGYTDQPTGLPNRSRFIEDIEHWRQASAAADTKHIAFSVDICGRDYFYGMVQSLGLEYANGFLTHVANTLKEQFAPLPLYRIDTTSFAIIDTSLTEQDIARISQALGHVFSQSIHYNGIPHLAILSIGYTYLAAHSSAKQLIGALSTAADNARKAGQVSKCFDSMQGYLQQRSFEILATLPHALSQHNQLSLLYQPKVDLHSRQCFGVEALLRWNHASLGNISPSEFIPLAEETALIRRITHWVLRSAFSQLRDWVEDGTRMVVSINISAKDIEDEEFVDRLSSMLSEYSINPAWVELEFTETAISRSTHSIQQQLEKISQLGLKISIDDFGAGYSNLNYLKDIPASTLKIDQSFIKQLPSSAKDMKIVPSLIHLGHDLGFTILAEGIETQEIFELLRNIGCNQGQGYWFSKPLPPSQIKPWMQAQAAVPCTY